MGKRFPVIEKFGRQVGVTDRAYAKLALYACKRAAEGEIAPEDAGPILKEFKEARRRGAGLAKQAEPPAPQQISKLRKIIEAGAYFKGRGVAMVKRTQEMHLHELQMMESDKLNYVGEYNAIVQVARAALHDGVPFDKDQIRKTLVIQ